MKNWKNYFCAGHGKLPPSRLPSLRQELLQFLLEDSETINSRVGSSLSSRGVSLNLYPLLELDTEATLDVLRCAFVEDEIPQPEFSSSDAAMEVKEENLSIAESQKLLVQNTVYALICMLDKKILDGDRSSFGDDKGSVEDWPSKKEKGYLFEFIAHYVASGRANVSKRVLSQILEYLTSEDYPSSASEHNIISKRREKQVLALLKAVPDTDWDASYVLELCEKSRFYQVHICSSQRLVSRILYL